MLDYTGTKEGFEEIAALIPSCREKLFDGQKGKITMEIYPKTYNEGFKTSGQVQYVCRCGSFMEKGLPYHGALKVLKVMMGYDYLWMNLRVKGGAYGCMNNFRNTGESYFVSYRDPNLKETLEVYEKAAEYIRNFRADERTMTKYVIGAISDKDMPLTPQAKGTRSMSAYFADYDFAMEQKERDELLRTDDKTIRSLAAYIDAFMEKQYICVIGSEEKIKNNCDLFEHIENLIGTV